MTEPLDAVDKIAAVYRLTAEADLKALKYAYTVFARHHAPFVTSVAADMLPELQARVSANAAERILFLGRDGHSLAIATHALAPAFFSQHCSDVVLSRVVVEAGLQDLERNAGLTFPELAGYRQAQSRVDPSTVQGAHRRLTRYLRQVGAPVGREGSAVTVVDSSLKGTVQELLSAQFPNTHFRGCYMFFSELPSDPHPGTKRGFVMHRNAHEPPHGDSLLRMPRDRALTFAHREALSVLEDTLHGPLDTPQRITRRAPEQRLQRDDPDTLGGFNPLVLHPAFREPVMREAVKTVALAAVDRCATETAHRRDQNLLWREPLHAKRERFIDQVRGWVCKAPEVDQRLKLVLDNFVRRMDHRLVRQLSQTLQAARLESTAAREVWRAFDAAGSLDRKAAFVQQLQRQAAEHRLLLAPSRRKPEPDLER